MADRVAQMDTAKDLMNTLLISAPPVREAETLLRMSPFGESMESLHIGRLRGSHSYQITPVPSIQLKWGHSTSFISLHMKGERLYFFVIKKSLNDCQGRGGPSGHG